MKNKYYNYIVNDVNTVKAAFEDHNLKVILETYLLTK